MNTEDLNRMVNILAICKYQEGYNYLKHEKDHYEMDWHPPLNKMYAFLGNIVLECISNQNYPSANNLYDLLKSHVKVHAHEFKGLTPEQLEHCLSYVKEELFSYWEFEK